MDKVGSIAYEASIDTRQFRKDARNLENDAQSVAHKMGDKISGGVSAVGNSATYLATRLAVVGAAFGLLAKNALTGTSEFQQSRIAFDTMLGSAEKGAKMMRDISDFAKRTPFELPEVVNGSKALLAYNIEAEKIIPTFNALGNIAAGVGKDKLPQLTLAFGQVRAAGKLTGAELRQFTEAGVPLLEVLAAQSGKTAAQVKEDMENGIAPSFEEVERAIMSMSEQGGKFYGLMEKQSQTFAGRMSNISDKVGQIIRRMLGVDVGGNVKPGSIFDQVSKAAERFMNWLENNEGRITDVLQKVIDFISDHGKEIVTFFGVTLVAAFVAWGVSTVAAAAPIVLLGAAVTGIIKLLSRFNISVDDLKNAWSRVVTYFNDNVKPFLLILWDILYSQLKPAWDSLVEAFNTTKEALAPFKEELALVAKVLGGGLVLALVTVGAVILGTIIVAGRLIKTLAELYTAIVETWSGLYDFGMRVYHSIDDAWKAIMSFLARSISTIVNTFGSARDLLFDAGRNIIDGVIDGMRATIGQLFAFIGNIAARIKETFTNALKIRSPSRVFIGYGKNIVEGLAIGLEDGSSLAQDALLNSTGMTAPTMASLSNVPSTGSGTTKAGSNIVVNQYLEGIMVENRAAKRAVAKDLITALDEELTAKGYRAIMETGV